MFTYIFFQNEKCHLLIEHETQKLKELDEEHSQEIKEWREKLRPRKKVSLISFTKCLFTHTHVFSIQLLQLRFFLCHVIFKVVDSVVCICCPLQALEEEFTRKLQEQEVFFKMSGESECLNPTTQSRVSKFYPIPNLHNSGL